MATIVLVHGAWQGGWIWRTVKSGLEMYGHRVLTPDLPGHGQDGTSIEKVTMAAYVSSLVKLIGAEDEPVHLAGHSMGGVVVAAVAEQIPHLLQSVTWICAMLPADGDCILSLSDLAPGGGRSRVIPSRDGLLAYLEPRPDIEHFMNGVDSAVIDWAIAQSSPQAFEPMGAKVALTPDRFGRVAKNYVLCTEDNAIPLPLQRLMMQRAGCGQIAEIACGHSPFFSQPWQLATILHRFTRSA